MQRGRHDFVVDLSSCDLMDSTFMGTLAGAALRLREIGEGSLKVIHASPRNEDLLLGLGLDQLFSVHTDGGGVDFLNPDVAEAPVESSSDSDAKETVLEAHEALAAADSANAAKFRDVIEFLKQESGGSADGEARGS